MSVTDSRQASPGPTHEIQSQLLSELETMNARLKNIEGSLNGFERRLDSVEELRTDVWPAIRGVAHNLNTRLVDLETSGALDFARGTVGVAEKVATSFTPEDMDQLGDSIVAILHTVRNLTQPEVLAVADRAAHVLQEPDENERPHLFRALRDPDVRRGLARMLAVMRELGSHGPPGPPDPAPHTMNPTQEPGALSA